MTNPRELPEPASPTAQPIRVGPDSPSISCEECGGFSRHCTHCTMFRAAFHIPEPPSSPTELTERLQELKSAYFSYYSEDTRGRSAGEYQAAADSCVAAYAAVEDLFREQQREIEGLRKDAEWWRYFRAQDAQRSERSEY